MCKAAVEFVWLQTRRIISSGQFLHRLLSTDLRIVLIDVQVVKFSSFHLPFVGLSQSH